MYQQYNRFAETPLSAAFGPNNRTPSTRPTLHLQERYYNQPLVDTEIVGDQNMTDNASNHNYVTPTFQNQLNVSFNQSIDQHQQEQAQRIVYYGDLEEHSCSKLKSFEKEPTEGHCCITFLNLLLYGTVIIFVVFFITIDIFPWVAGQIFGVPYLVYFFVGCCNNPMNNFFSNMKNYAEIRSIYEQAQRKRGHLKFTAECYHYTLGRHKRKVVTHMATQIFLVRQCIDASEPFSNFQEDSKYLFCRVKKYYYFTDQRGQSSFIDAFNIFKAKNTKDRHQICYHSLDLTVSDIKNEVGLSINGTGSCLKPIYYMCLALGIGCFYLRYIEYVSQRLSINVIKKLTI